MIWIWISICQDYFSAHFVIHVHEKTLIQYHNGACSASDSAYS